jgi:hypothetical protein
MASSYEVARLNLSLWLANPTTENLSRLDYALDRFNFWLARDWNKLTLKLWGYYHGVCAYRQKQKHLQIQDKALSPEESDHLQRFTSDFLAAARAQKGVRRYELRFTIFFLESKGYERFPGEPLKCELGDLLAEFKIF